MLKETEDHEKFEKSRTQASLFHRDTNNLSELARARIDHPTEIPETLESENYALIGIKKYKAYS